MVALNPRDPNKFWNPELARRRAMENMVMSNEPAMESQKFSEQVLPEHDYGMKALQLGSKTADLNYESAMNSAQNASNDVITQFLNSQQNQNQKQNQNKSAINVGANATGEGSTPRLKALMRALKQQESGGNYGAVNSSSGAMGAYQVMPSNLAGSGKGWDNEALGYDITPQQFLASKKLQNRIARYKFGQYLNKYGAKGALSAWYSGSPTRWNERTPQGDYPSVRNYVLQVLGRLNK